MKNKLLFVLMILFLSTGCGRSTAAPVAPDFEVQGLGGEKISLDQHRDKVLILEFWSVGCRACQVSFGELNELQTKYQGKGLRIVGITIDDPVKVNDDLLKEFIDYFKINFKIGRVTRQMIQDYFAGQFRISLPTIFIIDRKGRIVQRFEGFAPGEMEKVIKNHL